MKEPKKTEKENYFKKQYVLSLAYLIRSRWYIVFTFGIFSLAILIGFAYPHIFREEIFEFFRGLLDVFDGAGFFETWWLIFFNNLKASFISIILGLGFGVIPLVIIIVNGYIIGFTSRIVADLGGILELWRLFPHGIFELPAIIMSVAFGIRLGVFVLKGKKNLKREIKDTLIFFTYVVIPLLLLASLIEAILVISGI